MKQTNRHCTDRFALTKLVRSGAGKRDLPIGNVYGFVYARYFDACRINLKRAARESGMNVVEYADRHGHMNALYALAVSMYSPAPPPPYVPPKPAPIVPAEGKYIEPWGPSED